MKANPRTPAAAPGRVSRAGKTMGASAAITRCEIQLGEVFVTQALSTAY